MAIGAAAVVDGHGVIGWMADRNAGRVVQDDTETIWRNGRVIRREVDRWCLLVLMAVQAVDRAGVVPDDILHRGADRGLGVDVPEGVVAGGADIAVRLQDIGPVQDRVAV